MPTFTSNEAANAAAAASGKVEMPAAPEVNAAEVEFRKSMVNLEEEAVRARHAAACARQLMHCGKKTEGREDSNRPPLPRWCTSPRALMSRPNAAGHVKFERAFTQRAYASVHTLTQAYTSQMDTLAKIGGVEHWAHAEWEHRR
jgi:hypothetical protein